MIYKIYDTSRLIDKRILHYEHDQFVKAGVCYRGTCNLGKPHSEQSSLIDTLPYQS